MRRRLADLTTLGEVDVLSTGECATAAATVLDERSRWCLRSPSGRFATLGLNSYMDLAPSADVEATYFARVDRSNEWLDARFADLYRRLAGVVEREVGLAASYPDDLARPGFHIWVGDAIPREPVASIHFDLQYERLRCRSPYDRATGTMSFTLPVALPAAGAALHVWPSCTHPTTSEAVLAARRTPPVVIDYRLGQAIVHSGHVLHQVGTTVEVEPDDVRIMVQGHGLVVDNRLYLYW